MGEQRNIARAAGLMSAATMISRVLGYVRDMVIAFYLGATQISDAFFLAFRIPNLLRELFAEGSTASAVIPVLTEYEGTDRAEAARLVRIAFGFVVVVSGAVTVLGVVFAPQIVSVIGSGFTSEAQISLTVTLTRMMFPFLFFISLASVAMGALNTRRVFFVPAVAPAFLNICIIAMTFTIAVQYGRPVMGAALGVSLGGLVQFLVQVPLMKRHGYRLMPLINFNHPGLRKILKLVLPMTFTISVSQIYVLVASIIATYLPEGSITYLFYSMRLIHFPIGVFGVAMGMAVLPSLSAHAHRGDIMSVKEDFSFSLRLLFFITVPAMAGLIALREPIINLLFQHGNVWDYTATKKTGQALLFYSLGIWAVVGVRVMTSTFYSLQNTKTPMKVAALGLAVNIVLCLALRGSRHAELHHPLPASEKTPRRFPGPRDRSLVPACSGGFGRHGCVLCPCASRRALAKCRELRSEGRMARRHHSSSDWRLRGCLCPSSHRRAFLCGKVTENTRTEGDGGCWLRLCPWASLRQTVTLS
jgi:putative peptidoglycan lipid II flippase